MNKLKDDIVFYGVVAYILLIILVVGVIVILKAIYFHFFGE